MENGIDKKTDMELAKVLWVEDNEAIIDSHVMEAERNGLVLKPYSNWEDAEKELNENFDEYSAIILDAYCIRKRDDAEDEHFIDYVRERLAEIFWRNQSDIPWYIYSAGTMEHFDFVASGVKGSRREEWGDAIFLKDVPSGNPRHRSALFSQIAEIASQKDQNSVLYRHKDVFSLVGEGKLINSNSARKYMLDMFNALYYPMKYEVSHNANDLREVLGEFFKAANRYGLLADEYVKGGVVYNPSYSFMAYGAKNDLSKANKAARKFTKKYSEEIFPPVIREEMFALLSFGQEFSHRENKESRSLFSTKEEHFGQLFLLCHVIKWLDGYIKEHPDPDENRKKIIPDDKNAPGTNGNKTKEEKNRGMEFIEYTADTIIGKEFPVIREKNCWCAGSCRLSPECESVVKIGTKVTIDEVKENTDKDMKRYPFIAIKITPLGD